MAQQRSYRTLERLCSALADRLLDDFDAEEVWVKATKPEPPIPLAVEEVSVEVWRRARRGATTVTRHAFDRDTAVEQVGDGAFTARVAPRMGVPRGPNGGYIAAIVLRAMEASRRPRAVPRGR